MRFGREPEFADRFYKSAAWKRCRASYLVSVGSLCERCLTKGMIVPATQVHHKIKLTPENINRPEIALNWSNLVALCKDCHLKIHRKKKRWSVDENGVVTLRDPP